MSNDLIKILLQAELDTSSISKIKEGLKNIEKNNKPIEVKVVTDKAERTMIDFAKSMGIKLDKNLKTQFKGLSSSLLGDFDQSKMDAIHSEALRLNKVFDEQVVKARTLKGTFAELKGEQQDASKVAKILSDTYGGLEVRGMSINKTNGQYSVTLKQSAKENLVLKGTIDQVSGALRVQSEQVVQARNVQLGFWEQMKIALERVPRHIWGL